MFIFIDCILYFIVLKGRNLFKACGFRTSKLFLFAVTIVNSVDKNMTLLYIAEYNTVYKFNNNKCCIQYNTSYCIGGKHSEENIEIEHYYTKIQLLKVQYNFHIYFLDSED
jgi:hypothetical protein